MTRLTDEEIQERCRIIHDMGVLETERRDRLFQEKEHKNSVSLDFNGDSRSVTIAGRKFVFIQTSCGCPEQYDIKLDDLVVGYFRLRWGRLCVEYPYINGEDVYWCKIGDGTWAGEFNDENERRLHLTAAATALYVKITSKTGTWLV